MQVSFIWDQGLTNKGKIITDLKVSFLCFRNVPFLGFFEKTNKAQMYILSK